MEQRSGVSAWRLGRTGHVFASERHDDGCAAEVEQRQQSGGRRREGEVDRVVLPRAQQPAHDGHRRRQVTGGPANAQPAVGAAHDRDPVHRNGSLVGAIPAARGVRDGVRAARHDVHGDTLARERLRERRRRVRDAAARREIVVTQHQNAHGCTAPRAAYRVTFHR